MVCRNRPKKISCYVTWYALYLQSRRMTLFLSSFYDHKAAHSEIASVLSRRRNGAITARALGVQEFDDLGRSVTINQSHTGHLQSHA